MLYFLSPRDSPPFLFTVSAQSWYPRWAICPPVADSPDSSSTAPTLNVCAAPPPPPPPPHAASRLGPATTPPATRPARVRKRRRLMLWDMIFPLESRWRAEAVRRSAASQIEVHELAVVLDVVGCAFESVP